jgi:ABC-2 type transport system permease protein
VLVVPAGFAAARAAGRPASVQLIVDASDPLTVGSTTGAAGGLAEAITRQAAAAGVAVETDLRYNPEQISAVYIVPGLVGVILTFTLVLMTALAIARERERGTIEALIASPVRPHELIAGKLLPYIVIGYIQMTLVLALGALLFGIDPGGRLAELYLVAALFIAANLSVGLVFSTIAQSQGQAMQLAVFFLLPNVLLSGFMFPVAAMPAVARWISEALPLTHFLRVVRGMILKGASTGELLPEIAALAVLLAVLLVVATLRFRKRVA